jgi:hypothetical protein
VPVSANKSLQRSGTHKVLDRGRPSAEIAHERWRARVLKWRRAAAELGRWATASNLSSTPYRASCQPH